MNNAEFNQVISNAYRKYLETSSQSNQKLGILHGEVANDLKRRLGDSFEVKSLGVGNGKESKIQGKYIEKRVDIAIFKNNKSLGGIAVKFVMRNYSQNSNNYFENMLGETANLRSNGKAYFQLIIIPKSLPYFKKDGEISKIEVVSNRYIEKYIKLSEDDVDKYMHTPTKTLFYLINTPKIDLEKIKNEDDYKNHLLGLNEIKIETASDKFNFKDAVIYNDYEKFIDKVVSYIKFME